MGIETKTETLRAGLERPVNSIWQRTWLRRAAIGSLAVIAASPIAIRLADHFAHRFGTEFGQSAGLSAYNEFSTKAQRLVNQYEYTVPHKVGPLLATAATCSFAQKLEQLNVDPSVIMNISPEKLAQECLSQPTSANNTNGHQQASAHH